MINIHAYPAIRGMIRVSIYDFIIHFPYEVRCKCKHSSLKTKQFCQCESQQVYFLPKYLETALSKIPVNLHLKSVFIMRITL